MNTEFVVRMPAATGRTALGREQVTWTETAKFGELMPVSGRDYEFANVLDICRAPAGGVVQPGAHLIDIYFKSNQ